MIGGTAPGAPAGFRVVGDPGEPVTLAIGSGVQDPPQTTPYGDLYLAWPITPYNIGSTSADGILALNVAIPGFWIPGEEKPMQALVGPLGAYTSVLTHLMVLIVE